MQLVASLQEMIEDTEAESDQGKQQQQKKKRWQQQQPPQQQQPAPGLWKSECVSSGKGEQRGGLNKMYQGKPRKEFAQGQDCKEGHEIERNVVQELIEILEDD